MNISSRSTTNRRPRARVLAILATIAILAALALAGCAATGVVAPQSTPVSAPAAVAGTTTTPIAGQQSSGTRGGCCGGSGSSAANSAGGSVAATVDGNTQRVSIDASQGYFNPGQITVKAGIPTVMSFSKAPGGCLSSVVFPELGISQDLTAGPADVSIPALQPGTYTFTCQMGMVSGTLVVQ